MGGFNFRLSKNLINMVQVYDPKIKSFLGEICPGLRPQIIQYFIPGILKKSQNLSELREKSDMIPEHFAMRI